MPSTTTTNLSFEKPAAGEQNNTWGATLNTNYDSLDSAIAGRLSLSVAGSANVTLTAAQALNALIELTGALTGAIAVIVPASNKLYHVYNNTTGAYVLTFRTSAGSGIVIPQGRKKFVYCDATNVVEASDSFLDNAFAIVDNADTTKLVVFQASGLTAATTRTITVPDADITLASINTAQTVSAAKTHSAAINMSAASINEAEGAAVASATTTDIWTTDGNTIHVTGTTTITSLGTAPQAGAWKKVIYDGALILTQGANMNLNAAGANITTAADDVAFVYADTTTQMDVFVIRKSGAAVVASASAFTLSFISANQTITAAGALTLAHGLGVVPRLVQVVVECLTGDADYEVGDFLFASYMTGSNNAGTAITFDATNLYVRYGSNAGAAIGTLNETTGTFAALTDANWRATFRAYS